MSGNVLKTTLAPPDGARAVWKQFFGIGGTSMLLKRALQLILTISLLGIAFSGVLTYQEVFGASALACPAPGAPGTILGYPACVYGLFMYVAIAAVAAYALWAGRRATP